MTPASCPWHRGGPALMALVLLAVFITPVCAISDLYALQNGNSFQTCAYVSHSTGWLFNQRLPSEVAVSFMDFPQSEGLSVDFLAVSGEDLSRLKLPFVPAAKVCDETASNLGYCRYGEPEGPDSMPIEQMIERKSNRGTIIHRQLVPGAEKTPYVYKVQKSGTYCLVLRAQGVPKDASGHDQDLMAVVDWRQAFGRILVSDWRYLWLCWQMLWLYAAFALCYGYLVARRRHIVQRKVLLYTAARTVLFLAAVVKFWYMNRHGYSFGFTRSLLRLVSLVCNTLVTAWLAYNLILLTAGVYFDMHAPSTRYMPLGVPRAARQAEMPTFRRALLAVKLFCALLCLQLVVYDLESSDIFSIVGGRADLLSNLVFGEIVAAFAVFSAYGIHTCLHVRDKTVAIRLAATLALLSAVFIFEFVLRRAVIANYLSDKLLSIVHEKSYTYMLEYVVTVLVGLVWCWTSLEGEKMSVA